MWLTQLEGLLAVRLSKDSGMAEPLTLCGLSSWLLTWQWPRATFQEESPNLQAFDYVLLESLTKLNQ